MHFLARSLDPVRCDRGLTAVTTDTPATLPDPELIVVPGREKPVPVMSEQVLIDLAPHRCFQLQMDGIGLHRGRFVRRCRTAYSRSSRSSKTTLRIAQALLARSSLPPGTSPVSPLSRGNAGCPDVATDGDHRAIGREARFA